MAARYFRDRKRLDPRKIAEHGQYIFVYTSPKFNQVIYSLSRVLQSHRALKQLPFLGKHTKPGTLRKDAWQPLATISFPSGIQGLSAYKQLLEFRKRHEFEWTDAEMDEAARLLRKEREVRDEDIERRDEEWFEKAMTKRLKAPPVKGKGRPPWPRRPYWMDPTQLQTRNRRERAQVVMMTSKANCIADIAAVLQYQHEDAQNVGQQLAERRQVNTVALAEAQARIDDVVRLKKALWVEGTEDSLKQFKALKNEKMRLQKAMAKPDPAAAIGGIYSWLNDPRPAAKRGLGKIRKLQERPIFSMDGVKVEWANLLDAQFASSWPETVLHGPLPASPRGTRSRNVPTTKLKPPTALKLIESARPLNNESAKVPHPEAETPPPPTPPPPSVSAPPASMMEKLLHRLKHGATT